MSPTPSWKSLTVSALTRIGIRLRCRGAHQRAGRTAAEVGVLQRGNGADAARVHAVEILKIAADVGESVLDRLHRPYAAHGCQRFRASRRHGCTRCLGDGHVGAVGELCVDLGLHLIGGVEGRRGTGEGHRQCQEHDRAGKRCPLPGKGMGENACQWTGNWCQQDGHRATAPHQDQVGQPPDEQRTADPQQRRGDERPSRTPKSRARLLGRGRSGTRSDRPARTADPEVASNTMSTPKWVHPGARVRRTSMRAPADGDAVKVSPRRHQHRCCGDRQADGDGRHCPADRGGGVLPQSRGAEADQADQRRRSQTRGTAEDADHDRLGRREQISLLVVAPRARRSACSRRRRGAPASTTVAVSSAATTAAGETEEEEEHAGVGGIAAGGVERGGKVVTDQRGAGTTCSRLCAAAVTWV